MDFGELHLPYTAEAVQPATGWMHCGVNQILVVLCVLLAMLVVLDFIRLWPMLRSCMIRARGNISMEHSLRQARVRSRCAWICLLAFCLMADCYNFAGDGFLPDLQAEWRVPVCLGLMLGYLIFRKLSFHITLGCQPLLRCDSETQRAIHTALFNYFIVAVSFALLLILIFSIFAVPYGTRRAILLWIYGFFILLSIVRTGQILLPYCSGLGMFLYLCALEILPLAALLVTVLLL